MKIRNIIILTALILAVFCLGACGSADDSGQGSIIINFGGAARAGANDDYTVDTTGMSYSIKLTSSGKKIDKTISGTSVSIPVSEGVWNIKVEATGDRVIGRQKAENGVNVTVTAGQPASADIDMTVTETRVYEWDELVYDFKGINNGKLPDLKYIEIVGKLVDDKYVLTAYSNADNSIDTNKVISLDNEQTITLWAKTTVYIERATSITTNTNINVTVFTITKGTLILDGTKDGKEDGKIIIDGKSITNCQRALINVVPENNTDSATLIMRNGKLTNNYTLNGGGVYVEGTNACFRMEGGVISKNVATSCGGGVCVMTSGRFENIAGTIYGDNGGENSNTAAKGNAVCCASSSGSIVHEKHDHTINNGIIVSR